MVRKQLNIPSLSLPKKNIPSLIISVNIISLDVIKKKREKKRKKKIGSYSQICDDPIFARKFIHENQFHTKV